MLRKLLHHKEEPTEPEPEQPKIDLTDLEELITANEQDVINAIQAEPRLEERKDSLIEYLKRMERKPLELIEEKMTRRKKLNKIVALIKREIHNREQQKVRIQFQQEKKWNEDNLEQLLPNVRYCTRDIPLLMRGLLTIDVMNWNTPTSTKIEIRGTEFDLNTIHPTKWREMLQSKFHPIYIRTQKNAMRDGKPLGKWRKGSETYERNKQIQIGTEVIFALMIV